MTTDNDMRKAYDAWAEDKKEDLGGLEWMAWQAACTRQPEPVMSKWETEDGRPIFGEGSPHNIRDHLDALTEQPDGELCREAFEKWFIDDGAVCAKSSAWKTWRSAWNARPERESGSEVCHQLREAIMHLTHEKVFTKESAVIREMESAIDNYNARKL